MSIADRSRSAASQRCSAVTLWRPIILATVVGSDEALVKAVDFFPMTVM